MIQYWRATSAGVTLTALTACGAGLYGPSAGELSKSISSMSTVTTASLEAFPETARGALIDRSGTPTPTVLLCGPVRYVTYNSVLNQELQAISTGLNELAGESPEDLPGLLGAVFTPYAIGASAADRIAGESDEDAPDTPQERASAAAASAGEVCEGDLGQQALEDARNAYLEPLGNAQSHSAAGALGAGITIWQLLEPILSGGLRLIDQQRRAAAIRRYLSDENNQQRLRGAIGSLQDVVERQQLYRRRVAAASFSRAYAQALPDGFSADEREGLLEAAALYDDISQGSSNATFATVRSSLNRLIRVAEGNPQAEDFAEALRQLAASVRSFQKIAEQWESLEEGGENYQKWREALQRLGLSAPPAASESSD